jgi:hypothetical protein
LHILFGVKASVSSEFRFREDVLLFTDDLEIGSRALHHRRQQIMLLRLTKGLGVNNDLVLGIDSVVALDDAIGAFHLGALVVGHVTLPGLPALARLVVVIVQPAFNLFDLLAQGLQLLLLALDKR